MPLDVRGHTYATLKGSPSRIDSCTELSWHKHVLNEIFIFMHGNIQVSMHESNTFMDGNDISMQFTHGVIFHPRHFRGNWAVRNFMHGTLTHEDF